VQQRSRYGQGSSRIDVGAFPEGDLGGFLTPFEIAFRVAPARLTCSRFTICDAIARFTLDADITVSN